MFSIVVYIQINIQAQVDKLCRYCLNAYVDHLMLANQQEASFLGKTSLPSPIS